MNANLLAAGIFVSLLLLSLWLWLSRSSRGGPTGKTATRGRTTSAAKSLHTLFQPPGRNRDDLKQIKGVGKVIEPELNALGITSFAQIARFTAQDIERVDRVLDFKGRIQREHWVDQARELAKRKR